MNTSLQLHALYEGSPYGTGYTAVMHDGSIYCIASRLNTPIGRGKYFGNLKDASISALCPLARWHQISMEDLPEKSLTFLLKLVTNLNLQPVKAPVTAESAVALTVREKFLLWKKKIETSEP